MHVFMHFIFIHVFMHFTVTPHYIIMVKGLLHPSCFPRASGAGGSSHVYKMAYQHGCHLLVHFQEKLLCCVVLCIYYTLLINHTYYKRSIGNHFQGCGGGGEGGRILAPLGSVTYSYLCSTVCTSFVWYLLGLTELSI